MNPRPPACKAGALPAELRALYAVCAKLYITTQKFIVEGGVYRMKCEICEREREVVKCRVCGTYFCEICGDSIDEICEYCLDEEE